MNEYYEDQPAEITDPLKDAVNRLFGLSYLFPYQRLVIANILEAAAGAGVPLKWPGETGPDNPAADDSAAEAFWGGELPGYQIVILPTGAGKSLCFQLPAMIMEGPTLVIYPILSLMADQERRLRERGFSPVILRGGQSPAERQAIWENLRQGKSKFIIANPEVLLTPQVMMQLTKIKVIHIVIDEAHCVSEWGESFRPGYLEINTIIKTLNAPLVTAFTATASAPVLEKIKQYIFGCLEARQITGSPDRPNISYTAQGCIARNLAVRDLLLQNERPAIVFCSSRHGTEELSRYLINSLGEMEIKWHNEIRFYHAGLSREEKTAVEQWFLHNSKAVLVATCAFGMGVDKADIRTVIHRDCPPSVEAYLQEAGRAGRDGGRSKAVLLWGPDDAALQRRAKTETDRKRLTRLLNYARDITQCRRAALLAMLDYDGNGEGPETACCDVCEEEAKNTLREAASTGDFFRRNNRRYTLDEAVEVLTGAENIRWTGEEAALVINYLLKAGTLRKLKNIFWRHKITTGHPPPEDGPHKKFPREALIYSIENKSVLL
ncbi:MAG: RecQ family ATP-dependent DNA helicase [Treponema sp.]|nr:RecQ family ATP-dependent DNA helicase [Treponema sp.]